MVRAPGILHCGRSVSSEKSCRDGPVCLLEGQCQLPVLTGGM